MYWRITSSTLLSFFVTILTYLSWCVVFYMKLILIHICTADVDKSEEWSSHEIFQFKQLEEAWKRSGLQRDSNPWPPRYRCDALPTELWSHALGARSIYWVHIFPCSEMMWNFLYEIIHIYTEDEDESEEWSSQCIFQFKQLERRSLKKRPRSQCVGS